MPLPFRRTSTTSLLALSTLPDACLVDVWPADGTPYPVVIGPGVRHALGDVLARLDRDRTVVVARTGMVGLVDPGISASAIEIEDGEAGKSMRMIERLCRDFARLGGSTAWQNDGRSPGGADTSARLRRGRGQAPTPARGKPRA